MKNKICRFIDEHASGYTALSDAIWGFAETAYSETRSCAALADYLEEAGFAVTRGAGGIPTAFTATYGEGHPHIGFLGEFDALAGLAQTANSTLPDASPSAPGHGCGHNLLGVGSLAAAEAIKQIIDSLGYGRVTYFGCPAEEGGSGKTFMAREGLFDDLDAALAWHPGTDYSVSSGGSLANYQVLYRFHGIAAHAGACPHLGRSALDAVELMNTGVQYLREHIPTTARVHYAIINTGGYSPNVVQAEASVLYLMRMPSVEDLPELFGRINDIARGAALMTGTEVEYDFVKACSDTLPNRALGNAGRANMLTIPLPVPTADDITFGAALRATFPVIDDGPVYSDCVEEIPDIEPVTSGSTDIGDVSRVCPTFYCYAATMPRQTPAHSWQTTSCGKSPVAHNGMLWAAKVLAATGLDILTDDKLLAAAKEELACRMGGKPYICPIPEGVRPRAISDIR